jgi:parvulin-like peptidyl-prolyl isomerase
MPATLFEKMLPAAAWILATSILAAPRLGAQEAAAGPAELPPAGPLIESLPDVVAKVDGHPITKLELLRQADTMRLQAIQAGARDPAHQGKEFLDLVVDALVGEYLVYKDGQSRGITASDAEIDRQVQEMAAPYPDAAAFDRALAAKGLDRDKLREEIRQQLSIDKLFQQEIATGAELSDEALRAYYTENTSRLQLPPRVRARHILKVVPAGKTGEEVRAQLVEVRRKIVDEGAEFGQLAVSESDDANTRDLGGDVGWVRITGRKEDLGQLLDGLEVGQVSEVVQTQMGLHVFQVMERQPGRPATFEEARDEIVQTLTARHARQEVQRRIAELKAKADVEILM